MKIQLTFERDFTPNCDGCKHCKSSSFTDDGYGATKSFKHNNCAIGDENCIQIEDLFFEIDKPKNWSLVNTEVK